MHLRMAVIQLPRAVVGQEISAAARHHESPHLSASAALTAGSLLSLIALLAIIYIIPNQEQDRHRGVYRLNMQ